MTSFFLFDKVIYQMLIDCYRKFKILNFFSLLFTFLILIIFFPIETYQTSPSNQPVSAPSARILSSFASGLVAYYPFDGNADDQSGNGNHGVIHGGVTMTTDRFGTTQSACNFNGVDGFIEIPGQQFNLPLQMAISLWVKPGSNTQGTWVALLDKTHYGNSQGLIGGWYLFQQADYSPYYDFVNGALNQNLGPQTTGQMIVGAWNHLVLNKYSNQVEFYINGVKTFQRSISGVLIKSTGDLPLILGAQNLGASSPAVPLGNYYPGMMDDIMIFNRTLSEGEISLLHQDSYPTSQPSTQPTSSPSVYFLPSLRNGLLAYYAFSGNALDSSGNKNHGVVHSGVTSTTDRFGLPNNAYNFDGSTGYIEIPGEKFKSPYQMALSVWVYPTVLPSGNGMIINKSRWGSSYGSTVGGWDLLLSMTSTVKFFFVSSTSSLNPSTSQPGAALTINTWNHIVMNKNDAHIKYYINGAFQNEQACDSYIKLADNPILIGAQNGAASTPASSLINYFTGKVDDVMVFNRTLTSDEISFLYRMETPTSRPSCQPSTQPTSQPSKQPTRQPTSLPTTSPSAYFLPSLRNGLIAFYPFSGNANDMSGNKNHGALRFGVTPTTDRFGLMNNAYNFDGTSGFIEIPGQQFNPSVVMAISVWVYPVEFPNNAVIILDKTHYRDSPAGPVGGWYLLQDGDNNAKYYFVNSANTIVPLEPPSQTGATMTVNEWNHIVVKKEDSTIYYYLNGISISSKACDVLMKSSNALPLIVGAQNGGASSPATSMKTYFKGKIDDVMIFNRTLSLKEINSLYQMDIPTSQPTNQPSRQPSRQPTTQPTTNPSGSFLPSLRDGLVGYYPFDGNTNDNSGNTNHGRAVGGAVLTKDRFGSDASAYSFNGISSNIVIPTVKGFASTNNLTLSLWVKPTGVNAYKAGLLGKGTENNVGFSLEQQSGQTNKFMFVYWPIASSQSQLAPVQLVTDKWNHLVVTKRGTVVTAYLNNEMMQQVPATPPQIRDHRNYPMYFGAEGDINGNLQRFFNGSLDDIAIYNRSVSAAEVRQLFYYGIMFESQPNTYETQNLLLWYPFLTDISNYATGGPVQDASLYNGAQLQFPSYSRAGAGALYLDSASHQYMQINSFTTGNGGLTFTFWFKGRQTLEWVALFDFGNGQATNNIYFIPYGFDNLPAFAIWMDSNFYNIPAPSACNNNIWCFVAVTMTYSSSSNSMWTLYNNGTIYTTKTNPYPRNEMRTLNYFGKSNWNSNPFYKGYIGEFRLYQTVLTPAEVQALYSGWVFPTGQPSTQPTRQPSQQPTTQPTVRISGSLKNGLVAYYPFDGNAHDNSGNGNHGEIHNGVFRLDRFDVSGSAFELNGINSYIEIPGQQFNFPDNMTVAFWINTAAGQNDWATLFDKSMTSPHETPVDQGGWAVSQSSSDLNHIRFGWVSSPGVGSTSFVPTLTAGTWNHVAFAKSSSVVTSYFNGVKIAAQNGVSSTIVSTGNRPLIIGAGNSGRTSPASELKYYYTGKIDEVFIFNRTLSNWEVRSLYFFDAPTSQPSAQPSRCPSSRRRDNRHNSRPPSQPFEYQVH
jgi:hypothetical protein